MADGYDGRRIVVAAWVGVAVFAVTAVPAAVGGSEFKVPALAVDVLLFLVGVVVFLWAFAVALVRSSQGDDIVVASLFLVQGPVPAPVRRQLFAGLVVAVVIAGATGTADAFGILVPMYSLGLIGLWGARHGVYPPRQDRR